MLVVVVVPSTQMRNELIALLKSKAENIFFF